MNMQVIDELLQKLNYEWFLLKKEFFIREPLYVKKLDRIKDTLTNTENVFTGEDFIDYENEIAIDIDLEHYCWNSNFKGSTLKTALLDEQLFKTLAPPVDGSEICDDIIERIKLDTRLYSDATAINQYLTLVKKQIPNTISKLSKIYNDITYNDTLNLFLKNTEETINKMFRHIYEQIELIAANKDYRAALTLEKCFEVANIKVNGKRFITHAGDVERGTALSYLLKDDSEAPKGLKIMVDDWANNDVYYLLIKLSEIIKEFTPAEIERKRILYLKNKGKQFERRLYDNFKSQRIKSYPISKQKQIDQQLQLIF